MPAALIRWIPTSCDLEDHPALPQGAGGPPRGAPGSSSSCVSAVQPGSWHQSLQFKQVHPVEPIFSVRVGMGYRALGIREENTVIWFWIGSHADYDALIR